MVDDLKAFYTVDEEEDEENEEGREEESGDKTSKAKKHAGTWIAPVRR